MLRWDVMFIRLSDDGKWRAKLISDQDGEEIYNTVRSENGFDWKTSKGRPVRDDLQEMLAEMAGDMERIGARHVVFRSFR